MQWITVATPPFESIEQFDKVLAYQDEEPAGMEARYAGTADDGRLRIVTLWESKAHAERFFAEMLGPALAKTLGPEPVGRPEAIGIDIARSYSRQSGLIMKDTLSHPDQAAPTIDLTTFRVIHRAIVRDARLLATASAGFAPPTAEKVRMVAEYMDHYLAALHHHHEGEDRVIWPGVAEGSAGAVARLAELGEEHEALDPLIARIGDALGMLAERPRDGAVVGAFAGDAAALADLRPSLT